MPVLNALYDTSSQATPAGMPAFDFTICRNENGASFMAAAYGKLTGQPGICFVTRGPGATQASIGVHTAMQDSSPMLLFVGQVGLNMQEREAFQEIDYKSYFNPIAKWVTQIQDPDRIPEIIARAWTTALSGRPGPVVIALPEDVLSAHSNTPLLDRVCLPAEPEPCGDATLKSTTMLRQAGRPLILIGGAGWHAQGRAAITRFAASADIPVLAAFRYQDLYDNHQPTYAGDAGVGMLPAIKDLIKNADVILAIGVRFGEMTTDGYELLRVPHPEQKLIHVHISDKELGKIYVPDVAIQAGPNAFSMALSKGAPVAGSWSAWRVRARASYEASLKVPAQPGPVDMGEICAYLRTRIPFDAILSNGAGNFALWPNKFLPIGPEQRLLAPQSGAMGYGLPAAIAAKTVYPERAVICFAGDGDFQMTSQELGTAMQAGRQPVVLILNNGTYGTIRMHQERTYPDRVSGTTLQNPDFSGLARAYGYHAERVENTAEFAPAFERALTSPSGAVLDLNIGAEALTPRASLSEIRNTS